jgi:hypothetical protein
MYKSAKHDIMLLYQILVVHIKTVYGGKSYVED